LEPATTSPGLVRHEIESILRAEGPGFLQAIYTDDFVPIESRS